MPVAPIGRGLGCHQEPVRVLAVAGPVDLVVQRLRHGVPVQGDLLVAGHSLGLSERTLGGRVDGRPVLVGIRPESVSVGTDGIPATVEVVESLGHERIVTCSLGDGQEAVVRIDARHGPTSRGQRLHLHIDPDELVLFDADTEERIP